MRNDPLRVCQKVNPSGKPKYLWFSVLIFGLVFVWPENVYALDFMANGFALCVCVCVCVCVLYEYLPQFQNSCQS
jgi:hypothetical protein